MKILSDQKIGIKLLFGFSVMIVFMAFIGYMGYLSINKINNYLDDIISVRMPSIDSLIEADRDLQQLLVAERSMIFANSSSDLFKELVASYEGSLKQSDQRWGKFNKPGKNGKPFPVGLLKEESPIQGRGGAKPLI